MIKRIKNLLKCRKQEAPETGLCFEVFQDTKSEWRWSLRAGNMRIIGTSGEGYKNRRDCLHGIDLVRSSHQARLTVIKDK